MAKRKNRVAIVCDEGGAWFVRRIRVIEHDLEADEKVYRCDMPVGVRFETPEDALEAAKQFLGLPHGQSDQG